MAGLVAALSAGSLAAQDRPEPWTWGWRAAAPRFASEQPRPGGFFRFARVLYQSVRREYGGQGWRTDYPDADYNLMKRFGELTTAAVGLDSSGQFNHVVVRLTDPQLFDYPFIFMSDVGTARLTDDEAARLRDFLLRGGFLYVDDFWGEWAWAQWDEQIGRVLPRGQYPIVDLPLSHPLFHALYDVPALPQIPSIQFWRRSGGAVTSERGAESATPHIRAILDPTGRPMVLMTHNTDIADGWEREGEEYEYFHRFSPDAYALAINILIYAMSH
ncbi:MAG TPA: DUF4159 domain-containing protein [Gemmatimonadales bacterium]|nr:DUF4159 domain-containing protein [Gemmatimonadales bacterium]